MKSIPSLLILALFATLTFAVWAFLNRPTREPPWPARIQGFAFSPFRANEDPTHGQMPTDEEIDADLALLEGHVNAVRTYSVERTLADVPELAEKHDLNVALGVWLEHHLDKNEEQLPSPPVAPRSAPPRPGRRGLRTRIWRSTSTSSACTSCPTGRASMSSTRST